MGRSWELRPEPHKPSLVPEKPREASQGRVHVPCLCSSSRLGLGRELTKLLPLQKGSREAPSPGPVLVPRGTGPASPLGAA